jgi:hypothetical protein
VARNDEKSVLTLFLTLFLYVARTLKLTTLAPDIVTVIINGEEPSGLSLSQLVLSFPLGWGEQREHFGFC